MFTLQQDSAEAKFWLDPLRLERSAGFHPSGLRKIGSMIADSRQQLLDTRDEYFS
jgi:hypothetical protein